MKVPKEVQDRIDQALKNGTAAEGGKPAKKRGPAWRMNASAEAKAKAERRVAKRLAEQLFERQCEAHGLPTPVSEYEFAKDIGRKWQFDWLFEGWLALEVVGGVWMQGHHSRGQSQIDDMERRNEAQIMGYVVLEVTPQQRDSGEAFALLKRALFSLEEQP